MQVTKELLDAFEKDFMKAMGPLQEKYGVSVSLGRITYEEERFSARLTVNMASDPEDVARANFDAEAWKFEDIGIQPGMYRRIYRGADGREYAILELTPRARKYPIRSVCVQDGKFYRSGRKFIREWTDAWYSNILEDRE